MRNLAYLFIFFLFFIPLTLYAADTETSDQKFQSACLDEWMKHANESSDKVEFKNFGEKYCGCAKGKQLNTDEDLHKAARQCMSQTMLRATMDTLEDKQGLAHVGETDIETGCENQWKLIYPDMKEEIRKMTITYCQCVAPKLNELNTNRDKVTDQEWENKINTIADGCSGAGAAGEQSTTDGGKK